KTSSSSSANSSACGLPGSSRSMCTNREKRMVAGLLPLDLSRERLHGSALGIADIDAERVLRPLAHIPPQHGADRIVAQAGPGNLCERDDAQLLARRQRFQYAAIVDADRAGAVARILEHREQEAELRGNAQPPQRTVEAARIAVRLQADAFGQIDAVVAARHEQHA